jgi:hypothetical protein
MIEVSTPDFVVSSFLKRVEKKVEKKERRRRSRNCLTLLRVMGNSISKNCR